MIIIFSGVSVQDDIVSYDFEVKRSDSECLVVNDFVIFSLPKISAYKVMLWVCHWQKVHGTL